MAGVNPGFSRAHDHGVLIVKIKAASFRSKLEAVSSITEQILDNTYRVRVADKNSVRSALEASSWVEYAEEDGKLEAAAAAKDPLFVTDAAELTKQWYLPKIQAPQAWGTTVGLSSVVVAIVDTGIDGKHEELNDGRVVKGYSSYCQVSSLLNPDDCLVRVTGEIAAGANSDDNGHGTIVAGLAGAIANNDRGISGLAWNIKLMPIKVLDSTGSGLVSDAAAGIKWAADNGAQVINLSLGGTVEGTTVLQDAITYAYNKGIIIVAAAGNDNAPLGGNLNATPVMPVCADGGKNMVIGVAAVDNSDRKAVFSNYGTNCLDIAAPGTANFLDKNGSLRKGLVSTYYDTTRPGEHNLYVYASGTSMGAPLVSATAALMLAVFPDLDSKGLRDKLIASVDNIDDMNGTGCDQTTCVGRIGRGRLNVQRAVSTSQTVSSGTLVRAREGNLYLVETGIKRPVSSFVASQRFPHTAPVAVTDAELDTLALGSPLAPVDGTLVKDPTNFTVYVVEDGERHGLSYIAFVSRNLRFEDVKVLPTAELAGYFLGTEALVLNGVLIKSKDHPAVYVLINGQRQLMSYYTFLERGFDKVTVVNLTAEELARYPGFATGFLYPPPDGRVIKGDAEATVYLVDGGKLRGLTLEAFQNRNFSFAQVKTVSMSELAGYERGESLIN